jgi:hypothetical protein
MIKILSIGNSFSQDAQAYLYDLAKSGGVEIKCVNLFIGGCGLLTHWENAESDSKNYTRELNGQWSDEFVSIKDALLEDKWDYITLQQASTVSGISETYFPYIELLSAYVKKYAPDAKQIIHQTWAYEIDCTREAFMQYENNQQIMYNALKQAYNQAAQKLGLDILPCGDVIQKLRGNKEFNYADGGISLCRDGFHLSPGYGRYTAAAVWYEILLGNIAENDYIPAEINPELINLLKQTICEVCDGYKKFY